MFTKCGTHEELHPTLYLLEGQHCRVPAIKEVSGMD